MLLLAACAAYRAPATVRAFPESRAVSPTMKQGEPHATLVFLRHGQSTWNADSLFTGWADVELTTLGKNEAAKAATQLWSNNIEIDVAYTSFLKRARQTLDIVLDISDQQHVPVNADWRLNERMYGGLTGLNKKEVAVKYGADQVKQWRRSYDTRPPDIDVESKYFPADDPMYFHIPASELPLAECLKDTMERALPYWHEAIVPALKRGKTVLIAAHGNSIRGLLKYLDDIPDGEVTELEIPTGIPLVYKLDADLQPIPADNAVAPLTGVFLGDAAAIAEAREAVAQQSVARYDVAKEEDEPVFACIGSGCLMLSNDEMKEGFEWADSNGDGFISESELKATIGRLSDDVSALSDEEISDMFSMIDRNSDGMIDYEEYVQFLTAES